MSKDKREPDYPAELESQFLMRLPEEPAKHLRNILKTDAETLKNRLAIQVDNDMRHGEVKLDNWTMHAKIVDLPTIVESLKTIDNKSFYKTADISQMMICKEEPDQPSVEDESQAKAKKKDLNKVDKKFLFPHGITPPTKNVRKRRFRKTLKKKYAEAPEIEKEVKRLLRADNEADSVTWEIVKDEEVQPPIVETINKASPTKQERKHKKERARKRDNAKGPTKVESTTRVVDIFGGAVSDSDLEDNANNVQTAELDDSRNVYDSRLSDAGSMHGGLVDLSKADNLQIEFSSLMFDDPPQGPSKPYEHRSETPSMSAAKSGGLSSEDDGDHSRDSKENMTQRIEQARIELEELKQRKQRTQNEIAGMDNLALRQRFQDILHTLNQDIMYKEMEYQGMITLQNSEDI